MIVAAGVGHFVEWFDFAVFGAGFVMRPRASSTSSGSPRSSAAALVGLHLRSELEDVPEFRALKAKGEVVIAALVPFFGLLSDKIGRKPVILAACINGHHRCHGAPGARDPQGPAAGLVGIAATCQDRLMSTSCMAVMVSG
ncbi:MFS family permease [Curtobacterium pusillum]|uniref:MFS family permease n=1 Tax=Curtobacterium pusillum TaxID=69373 RepID=A0AAW3T4J7_9MICO|nr:hypothetical protein [Curtobacterium pusillum]MBA8989537.1 MFS family permease [Curtobacterium pusillum]